MRNLILDKLGILNAHEVETLNALITSLNTDVPGAEICIEIIGSNNREDPHSAGVREYSRLGLGKAGMNNGALIVFAMKDRHVELTPGTRYKTLFNRQDASELLKRTAVPHMQAGRQGDAIVAAATEVADKIRSFESGHADDSAMIFTSKRVGVSPSIKVNRRRMQGKRTSGLIGLIAFVTIGFFGVVSTHLCPKCHHWMSIQEKVISAPTYTSSGIGERIENCNKCNFHQVVRHSISTESERSSSSSHDFDSDGGGSSDGGGGGGADW